MLVADLRSPALVTIAVVVVVVLGDDRDELRAFLRGRGVSRGRKRDPIVATALCGGRQR